MMRAADKLAVHTLDDLNHACSDMKFGRNQRLWVHYGNSKEMIQSLELKLHANRKITEEVSKKNESLNNTIQSLVLQLHGACDDLEWEEFCEENEDLQEFIDRCEVTE